MPFRKCGMVLWRLGNSVPQMRNGIPEAREQRSASAEWYSGGSGIAFRKCGMALRRLRNNVPQMRNDIKRMFNFKF